MRQITATLTAMRRDERGATAIEYALLLGLIAGAIIGTVSGFGGWLSDSYQEVNDRVASATAD